MYRNKYVAEKKGKLFHPKFKVTSAFRLEVAHILNFRRLVIFGANITPVDIICHLPILCEDNNLPYVYSTEEIGLAAGLQRTTVAVLVQKHSEYEKLFDECANELEGLLSRAVWV